MPDTANAYPNILDQRSEKLFVSKEYKAFIITGQPEAGKFSGLRVKPFNQLLAVEVAALEAKAQPMQGSHIKISADGVAGSVNFTDEVTGSNVTVPVSEFDKDVQEKLNDPFTRLANTPAPKKPSTLAKKFLVAVLGLSALATGIMGVNTVYQSERQQPTAVTETVTVAPVTLTGIHEADARKAPQLADQENGYILEQIKYFSQNEANFLRTVDAGNVAVTQAIIKSVPSILKSTGNLAMVMAAKNGDLDMINTLHASGVSAAKPYYKHGTAIPVALVPLHQAVERGMPQTVDLLLSLKADPNLAEEGNYQTPFMKAADSWYDETIGLSIMDKLAKAGANVTAKTHYGYDALYEAAHNQSVKKMEFILTRDPDAAKSVNNVYNDAYNRFYQERMKGATLLMVTIDAYGYDHAGISPATKLLIDRGADLTAKDEKGWTVLHHAAALDQIDLVKYLINKKGMDPREKTADGWTALDVAKAVFPHPINAIDYLGKLGKAKTPRPAPVTP